mmetsp:Transcript_19477/g.40774  ORF Transcript_19477/g.40774 Transcript_19477/m.40774 type:complete len:369 (+) Transcript_19477:143-1249(+)
MSSDDSSSSSSSKSVLYDVLGSASAGVISRIFTHPLDTAKARLQAPVTFTGGQTNTTFRGPLDALLRTYRHEGLRALYGGFGAVIIGGTPGTVLYLTGYAAFRDSISSAVLNRQHGGEYAAMSSGEENVTKPSLSQGQEFMIHFASGMLAEALACIIYVPVDVVKERMQVQRLSNLSIQGASQNYHGSWDALQKIIKTEGTRGIYKGYAATLASFGPFSALYFMFYERCKLWSTEYLYRQSQETDTQNNERSAKRVEGGDLPSLHLVACSAGAGALASWLTSPLDMAKLRLQVQRRQSATGVFKVDSMGNQTVRHRGMVDCLQSAYKEGGVRGLFRGAGARVIHFAPATTITMVCYEKFRLFSADALG